MKKTTIQESCPYCGEKLNKPVEREVGKDPVWCKRCYCEIYGLDYEAMKMENMKFETNKRLEDFFLDHGFKETTDEDYKHRGKKEFRKGRRKRVIFDYINISLCEGAAVLYHKTSISREDLTNFIEGK